MGQSPLQLAHIPDVGFRLLLDLSITNTDAIDFYQIILLPTQIIIQHQIDLW